MSQSEEGAEETGSGDMDIKSYSPGTYVHEPMCNDDVFVWIDKNKAPDSNLYYAYKTGDTKAVLLHKDVTSFTVGNDFIVYCYNQIIYAYFYKQGTLVQVSQSNNYAMLPQAYGSLIVWEDKTGKATSDVFKYNIVE